MQGISWRCERDPPTIEYAHPMAELYWGQGGHGPLANENLHCANSKTTTVHYCSKRMTPRSSEIRGQAPLVRPSHPVRPSRAAHADGHGRPATCAAQPPARYYVRSLLPVAAACSALKLLRSGAGRAVHWCGRGRTQKMPIRFHASIKHARAGVRAG